MPTFPGSHEARSSKFREGLEKLERGRQLQLRDKLEGIPNTVFLGTPLTWIPHPISYHSQIY